MSFIGVFDSGVGGLTVLKALRTRWPNEDFIYLADTARLPYGSKSLKTIAKYAEQNLAFLQQFDLKAVVVACNSASTAILEHPIAFDVPIFNVVEPGARKATEASTRQRIGVLGTRATVLSGGYVRAIHKLMPEAQVFQQPCPLFVPLVEEGWIDDPVTNLIVYRYIHSVTANQIDALILGCTHYPVLKNSILKAVGNSVRLIDSSEGLIEDLSATLKLDQTGPGRTRILCTDYSPRFEETVQLLLPDVSFEKIETVNV